MVNGQSGEAGMRNNSVRTIDERPNNSNTAEQWEWERKGRLGGGVEGGSEVI